MEAKYLSWVEQNVEGDGYGECDHYTRVMQEAFPELRRARGFYYCFIWGERQHWWLVDPNGSIVDPTAAQFPSRGTCAYRELSDEEVEREVPIGKCANCGEPTYRHGYSSDFCSENCGISYIAYINASLR